MSQSNLGAFFNIDLVGGGLSVVETATETTITYTGSTTGNDEGVYITLKDEFNYNLASLGGGPLSFPYTSSLDWGSDFVLFQMGLAPDECYSNPGWVENGHNTLQGFYVSGTDTPGVYLDTVREMGPDGCQEVRHFKIAFPYNYTRPLFFSMSVDSDMFMEATIPQFWRSFVRTVEIYE